MSRIAIALCLSLMLAGPAFAQATGTPADHDALRKLKAEATAAVNARDYPALEKLLHHPFMATVETQASFDDFGKLKDYFKSLFTRNSLRIKDMAVSAQADDLSQIYTGTFAVTKGGTKERYVMADGRSFNLNGRWTAVSIKENGEWKLLAVHSGVDFLDNPVLLAVEKSSTWFGFGGLGLGALLGFGAGWFIRKPRAIA